MERTNRGEWTPRFKETWKRNKVNDTDHEIYGEDLLRAVTSYKSQHL